IQTVAVYSEADQKAPFVTMADESFLLGPPRVSESYLNIEKIIEIAKKAEVDANHPGYGFLSESGQFAEECVTAEFIFIRTKSSDMEKTGIKITDRQPTKNNEFPVHTRKM